MGCLGPHLHALASGGQQGNEVLLQLVAWQGVSAKDYASSAGRIQL